MWFIITTVLYNANNLIWQVRLFFISGLHVPCSKCSVIKIQLTILLKMYWSVENSACFLFIFLIIFFYSFLSNTGIGFEMLPGQINQSQTFIYSYFLHTYCQVCGIRMARYLLCKVLFMKCFSSGWSRNNKVDFCCVDVTDYQRPGYQD